MGLGETVEDRIDLALEVRKIRSQIHACKFTESNSRDTLEHNPVLTTEEMRRIVTVFRFCFGCMDSPCRKEEGFSRIKEDPAYIQGQNAAISGDMLTTAEITIERDMQMLRRTRLHCEIKKLWK